MNLPEDNVKNRNRIWLSLQEIVVTASRKHLKEENRKKWTITWIYEENIKSTTKDTKKY